jgi:hypothetical protein
MENDINELKKKFYIVKNLEWVESCSNDTGGIGRTFEKLIGLSNNEFEIPDFNQIEIKTKNKYSKSYTTLFSCTPTGPHCHEVERLKEKYGYPDSILKQYKVLNTSIYANEKGKVGLNYFFKLKIDKSKEKIFLLIYNKKDNLIEDSVYWDFDIIKEKLYRKLKFLAYVKAIKKVINGKNYFKYYEMKLYKLKNFEEFINLLDIGVIRISIKIGVFREGKRKGKIHDHGTSFCIQEENLNKLYELINHYR